MSSRWIALLLIGLGGCCGGPSYLTIGVAHGESQTSPRWGERMEWRGRSIVVSHPVEARLAGTPIEVYRAGSSEPLSVPQRREHIDNNTRNGCGESYDITFDLSELPPGEYTIVHRRRTGTGDKLNCVDACPWTTFAGEEALVMTLVLLP